MGEHTTRVNFQMDKASLDRLKSLKSECGAASYAEVTANAYRLYEYLIALEKGGGKLVVQQGDSEETLRLFIPG